MLKAQIGARNGSIGNVLLAGANQICICTQCSQLACWLLLAWPEGFPWLFPFIAALIAAPPARWLAKGGKSKQFGIASEMTGHGMTVNIIKHRKSM